MKLILFSDLHRDKAAAARIVELARNADVVVGAGDFASVRRDISNCIDVLASSRIPAVLVAGNNESHDELVAACKNWKSAHVLFVNEDSSGRSLGNTASLVRGSSSTAIPQPSWIGKSRWPPARIVRAFSFRQWAGCCLCFYCLVT